MSLKKYIFLVFFNILIVGVSPDIDCFIKKQLQKVEDAPLRDIGHIGLNICWLVRHSLEEKRKDAADCSLTRISVQEALDYTKDLCTLGWDLNNEFLKHLDCFRSHLVNAQKCVIDIVPRMGNKELDLKQSIKKVCSKLDDAYKCLNRQIGIPCGAEKFTQKLTKAFASYSKGVCIEVNAAATTASQWSALLGVFSDPFDCSYQAERRCGEVKTEAGGEIWPGDARTLDETCSDIGSRLDCQIAFAERCPKSLLRAFLDYFKATKTLYTRLCTKIDNFRTQYLRNIQCLNKHVSPLFETCRSANGYSIKDVCGNTVAITKCAVQGISDKCGSEGRQVFDKLYEPMLIINSIFCQKKKEAN